VLIEGCAVQMIGLASLVLMVAWAQTPSATLLALVLAIFGYGQGLVMAALSSAVLSTVNPASAGSGAGMYGMTAQIANARRRCCHRRGFFCDRSRLPRRGWDCSPRQRCLCCRLPPAPRFCHGCDAPRRERN